VSLWIIIELWTMGVANSGVVHAPPNFNPAALEHSLTVAAEEGAPC
jgi:hypothetical protein